MSLVPIDFVVTTEDEIINESDDITAEALETSRTWHLDFHNGRIGKIIDHEEAVRQYIQKALMTTRSRYLIYDDFYGEQISDLLGESMTDALIEVEVPRLVREAIIYDERIADIPVVSIAKLNSDSIVVSVTVELISGEFILEEVVF